MRGGEIIDEERKALKITPRAIPDAAIVDRLLYALVNEGAHILAVGIAQRASDIDVVYLWGYGFPAQRGGPMFYADRVGLDKIADRVRQFHRDLGPRWAPAPLLERLARDGVPGLGSNLRCTSRQVAGDDGLAAGRQTPRRAPLARVALHR